MSEVLSQNEIDELLRAMASGESETAAEEENVELNVRSHDFRLANKFSKEQLRTIDIVYDNYAQTMGNYLAGVLRAITSVQVLSVEEITFRDFMAAMPEPVILALINLPPLVGSCLMTVSPQIAYAIISHVFGGADALTNTNKPFTEIELAAITRIIRQLLLRMGEAWQRVTPISPSLDRIETSPQFAQIVSTNDAVAIITLQVTIGTISDYVSICIPHVAIEPITKQLSTKMWFSSGPREIVPQGEVIQERVLASKVTLQAVFHQTTASVRDIIGLQVGDVIRLDHMTSQPLCVKVEHLAKFHGFIGTMSNKYAVRITEVVKEDATDE